MSCSFVSILYMVLLILQFSLNSRTVLRLLTSHLSFLSLFLSYGCPLYLTKSLFDIVGKQKTKNLRVEQPETISLSDVSYQSALHVSSEESISLVISLFSFSMRLVRESFSVCISEESFDFICSDTKLNNN